MEQSVETKINRELHFLNDEWKWNLVLHVLFTFGLIMFRLFQESPMDPTKTLGIPIKYEMRGYNTLLGSHYDHYYLIYDWFANEIPSQDVFKIPKSKKQFLKYSPGCNCVKMKLDSYSHVCQSL
jgi:hypothetical protein